MVNTLHDCSTGHSCARKRTKTPTTSLSR
jgi:hypothetical protein